MPHSGMRPVFVSCGYWQLYMGSAEPWEDSYDGWIMAPETQAQVIPLHLDGWQHCAVLLLWHVCPEELQVDQHRLEHIIRQVSHQLGGEGEGREGRVRVGIEGREQKESEGKFGRGC